MRHYHFDRIISIDPGVRAVAVKCIALSDDVFTHHFPGNPVLPGVYLLEGMAQAAGVLLARTTDFRRIALMVSLERARFSAFGRPGDTVQFTVEIESMDEAFALVRANAAVQDRGLATARFTFKLEEPDRLVPPLYQPFWKHDVAAWLGEYLPASDA